MDRPSRAIYASNLGSALLTRYVRTGTLTDLDEAVAVLQQALAAVPANHPDRAATLSNLAGALRNRFERKGTAGDLDDAIASLQQAVAALPIGDRRRAIFASNLGGALQVRLEQLGAPADLDEAVRIGREAVATTPMDHPERAKGLSNLGRTSAHPVRAHGGIKRSGRGNRSLRRRGRGPGGAIITHHGRESRQQTCGGSPTAPSRSFARGRSAIVAGGGTASIASR